VSASVTVAQAGALEEDAFVDLFGGIYEHSPWAAREAWRRRPFPDFDALAGALEAAVRDAPTGSRLELVRAHPELAGREAQDGELTEDSTAEQAAAGLHRLSAEDAARLQDLNRAYREKFGFPLVIAVRGRDKDSIIAYGQARLQNGPDEELQVAIGEIVKIARLRLSELVTDSRIVLGRNSYGKSEVRLVKVIKGTERHELRDLRVDVSLEGDFAAAHVTGDNSDLLATDTMRNTVYALASEHLVADIESFGHVLGRRFVQAGPTVEQATVRIVEYPWARIELGGRPHPHAFRRAGGGARVATVVTTAAGATFAAGIEDLLVLRTTDAGFEGFVREEFTTLPETADRIVATVVTATWDYVAGQLDFDRLWEGVRDAILRSFADRYSPSVQTTLYHMGEEVLKAHPEIARIHFSLPNKHHLLYDLGRFGIENDNTIFHASSEPYGLIEGTVERAD
jgi:urate oxidase